MKGECATDEDVSVRLVDAVLHGLVDEVRVRRRLSESGSQNGETLQVEDLEYEVGREESAGVGR